MDRSPPGPSAPWDFPGKNTGVGCHFLFQGILPTQGLNPGLLHWQAGSSPLSRPESPVTQRDLGYSRRPPRGRPHRGSPTPDTEPGETHSSLCRTHSGRARELHSSRTPSSPSGFSPRHSRVRRGVLARSEARSSQAAADRFPFSSLQGGRGQVSPLHARLPFSSPTLHPGAQDHAKIKSDKEEKHQGGE